MSKNKTKLKTKEQVSKSNKRKNNKKKNKNNRKNNRKNNSFKTKNVFTSILPITLLIIPTILLIVGSLDYSKKELNLYKSYIVEELSKYIKDNSENIDSINFNNDVKQYLLKNLENEESSSYVRYINNKIIRNLDFTIDDFENSYILRLGDVFKDEISKIETNIVIPKKGVTGYIVDILNIEMDKNYNTIAEGVGYNHMYYKSLKKAHISDENTLILRFLKDENLYLTDKKLDKNFDRFKEEYQNLLNELDLNSFSMNKYEDFNKSFKKLYLSSDNKTSFNYKEIVVENYCKATGRVATRIDEFGANTLVDIEERTKYYIYE